MCRVGDEFMVGPLIIATTCQEMPTQPVHNQGIKKDCTIFNLTPLPSASTFLLLQLSCCWFCFYPILYTHSFIHSFIFCNRLSVRVTGGLEPIPADFGREAGYTLDKSPVHRRANTERQTCTHSHIHTYGQFRDTN